MNSSLGRKTDGEVHGCIFAAKEVGPQKPGVAFNPCDHFVDYARDPALAADRRQTQTDGTSVALLAGAVFLHLGHRVLDGFDLLGDVLGQIGIGIADRRARPGQGSRDDRPELLLEKGKLAPAAAPSAAPAAKNIISDLVTGIAIGLRFRDQVSFGSVHHGVIIGRLTTTVQ